MSFFHKIAENNGQAKSLISDNGRHNRICNANGSQVLNYCYKAGFMVDLTHLLCAISSWKDIATLFHDETTVSQATKMDWASFLPANTHHNKMWYTGVFYGLDWCFYLLMAWEMGEQKRHGYHHLGHHRPFDKSTITHAGVEFVKARLRDMQHERISSSSVETAIEEATSAVVSGVCTLHDEHCRVAYDRLDANELSEFKTTTEAVFQNLNWTFTLNSQKTDPTFIPWEAWHREEDKTLSQVLDVGGSSVSSKDTNGTGESPVYKKLRGKLNQEFDEVPRHHCIPFLHPDHNSDYDPDNDND